MPIHVISYTFLNLVSTWFIFEQDRILLYQAVWTTFRELHSNWSILRIDILICLSFRGCFKGAFVTDIGHDAFWVLLFLLKFIYSEKATKFCEIFTFLLSYVVPVKSKVKILQNFVAFSEYTNFKAWKFLRICF